jgi:hypothetical protein
MASDSTHDLSEAAALRERLAVLERENGALRQRLQEASLFDDHHMPCIPSIASAIEYIPSETTTEVHFTNDVQVAEIGDDGMLTAFDIDDETRAMNVAESPFTERPCTAIPPLIRVGGKPSPLSVLTNRPPVFFDLKALMPTFWNSVRVSDASNRSNSFVSVSTAYDQSHTGGSSDLKKHGQGTEGSLQQIFYFYAARQSISDAGNGAVSFEDIMRANTTMSKAELNKFLDDMVSYCVPREFVREVFLVSNLTEGISDEVTSELNFEEFCLSLVKLSVYIFHDDDVLFPDVYSRKSCVIKMAEHLNLDDPVRTERHLKLMARSNAGFGAWKMPPDAHCEAKKERKVRVRRTTSISKLLPSDKQELAILVAELLSRSHAKSKMSWQSYPACYIGMHAPSTLPSKRVSLSVTVRNKSANSMSFFPKMQNLPPLCFKFLPPQKCPPGMDWCLRMYGRLVFFCLWVVNEVCVTLFRWIDLPAPASISSGCIEIYDVSDSQVDNLVISVPVLVSIVDLSRGHQDFSLTFEPAKTIRLPGAVPKDYQNLKRNLCVPIIPQHLDVDDESPSASPRSKTSGSSPFSPVSKGKMTPGGEVREDGTTRAFLNGSPSKNMSRSWNMPSPTTSSIGPHSA